jgi:predicted amidohydrolase YtcJ
LIAIARIAVLFLAATAAVAAPADRAYYHGSVFTADGAHRIVQAIAIRDGRIVYVGDDAGLAPFIGEGTVRIDLKGGFLMPGVIDGHLHPLEAGRNLLHCSLDYAPLTVPEFQARIQACLDASASVEPDGWLEAVGWFQEGMRPAGVTTSRATLDALRTKRPIIIRSSFGHTVLANSRALALAAITAKTSDPVGGRITKDGAGEPNGLLEDAAFEVFRSIIPAPTPEQDVAAARAALAALNRQGVTSFLDAMALPEDLAAFSSLSHSGELTARAHFAPLIEPKEAAALEAAVARVVSIRKRYDEGAIGREPRVTVRNAKLFLDGVIAAPALTGALLEPYRRNAGTDASPHFVAGTSRGPAVYFNARDLARVLSALAREGIDPHLHADGDGAVHAALDGIQAMRTSARGADIRPAIAHDEMVGRIDYARFRELDATPVISFQWDKPAGDTLGLRPYIGQRRMAILEPAGLLAAAGARIAFGSDWPVDALDEWFAFKVGVTRTNAPDAGREFAGRLGKDPGLSPEAVLRAATINAAYELHEDEVTGSLELGKLADLIVLDRNPLTVPPEDIAKVKVEETVVGGRVVYARH